MFKKPLWLTVDLDQTAPIGSTLFASILRFVSNVRKLFAADNFSRRHLALLGLKLVDLALIELLLIDTC